MVEWRELQPQKASLRALQAVLAMLTSCILVFKDTIHLRSLETNLFHLLSFKLTHIPQFLLSSFVRIL